MPQITSGLITDKQRIQRALLEVIAVRLATSKDALDDYLSKTLLAHAGPPEPLQECVETSLKNLQSMGFITADVLGNYQPTKLGHAIVASALDPDDGVFIHKELEKALQAFVMDGEMHILYTFTPVHDFGTNINWQVFRNEMENLDDSGHRVLGFLGLKRAVINRLAQGSTLKETTPEEKEIVRVHRRFYLAFQLRDLCNEVPVHAVARKYDVPRGAVQNLSQTCHGFAAGMIKFCKQVPHLIKGLLLTIRQAQPSKLRIKGQENIKYEEKLMAKAQVISNSANRLWQMQMQQEVYEEEG
ncbi:hypothetical protein COL940_000674 [Colletotrichum noveboracense]|nr:hypothetical protein COL940_000674 [Colletotrichum noveboracense]